MEASLDPQKIQKEIITTRYSERLIFAVIAYYKALDGHELIPEEAELYCDSLADLGRCLKESVRQGFGGGGGVPPLAAPDPAPSSLSLFSEHIST